MDKAIGSVFGAAASATKMLMVDNTVLTIEEVKARILLAILVGVPGAIVGYIVTVLCKHMHRKIKTGIERARVKIISPKPEKINKRNFASILIAIIAVILFTISLPVTCHHKRQDIQASFIHVNSKVKSNIRVAVIAGHGSILNGSYLTNGKQSPEWENGLKIYEGYSTRQLAYDLASSLSDADIDVDLITPDSYDISLYQRVFITNSIYRHDKRLIVISLHHNAQPDIGNADFYDNEGYYGWYSHKTGGATGIEVFTSIGQTESDIIAELIITKLQSFFPNVKMRTDLSDGDMDKEANFYVLRKTASPAVLIEWMFMTNFNDCQIIANNESRQKFVKAVTIAISEYNQKIQHNE